MNRNVAAILAVLAIGIILGMMVAPALLGNKNGMTVTFYDADGNEVCEQGVISPLFPWGMQNSDGDDVVSAGVDISYSVITTKNFQSISVSAVLEVRVTLNTMTGGHVYTSTYSFGPNLDREHIFTGGPWSIETLLPESARENTGYTHGWGFRFQVTVVATGTYADGTTEQTQFVDQVYMTLVWVETTTTFSVTGGIQFA